MTQPATVSPETVSDTASTPMEATTGLTVWPIGLAVFDPRRRLLLASPDFATLLALPPDRLVAGLGFNAMLTLMATRVNATDPEAVGLIGALRDLSPGIAWNAHHQRIAGRSIDIMLEPLPDGGCVIVVNDVASHIRTQQDIQVRARLLDQVLGSIPHGICVYGADHRVAMFNDTYNEVMTGAPIAIGDSRSDIIRRRAKAGEYGEDSPDVVIAVQGAFEAKHPWMRRRVRPNGTAIDVRTEPLPDGGFVSVVTDVTALVQAETELRLRAAEMATMLGNIRQGIMLWGADKCLVASNPVIADLLDLPPGLLTPGRPEIEVIAALTRLGHFGTSEEDSAIADQMVDLDRTVPFGREFVTRSGRVLHAQSNPAQGGGWISTFTDISLMRQTESELRRAKELAESANHAKSRFLATMSHELRTPLNAIIGFSDALARENGGVRAEVVAEYSGQINEAGKQLLSLINIILDVARIESGRFEPNAEIVDISRAVHVAIGQADNAARAGGVTIECSIPEDLPWLRGDERRITQALSQLLSNAVKFSNIGGLVTVAAGLTSDADLFVSVTDTGIGIPAAELERVFEPFTQLDGSLSRRYAGAGLGLFTARAVVTAHGGRLQLTSLPDEGTTVRIVLPGSRILSH